MAAADLNVSLILRLVDQATGPARAAMRVLRQMGENIGETGRAGMAWSDRQLAASRARRSAMSGEALQTAAMGAALAASLKPAIDFESAMAGVSKVIDFQSPEGLKALESDILSLTSSGGLPMAAEGIAAIIEAAGQAGVVDAALPDAEKRAELVAFAAAAARMGTAFDISAGAAGSAMAQWRKAMGLSQERALSLGDTINHLSNNMNATAPALVDVIRRQGAVAMTAGLAEDEVAGLAAAFLSGGAAPEVAATALKNFTGALTDGEAMTARQRKVMQALDLDAGQLAQRMQVDAKGAILDVMEALSRLPAHVRGASLSQLFGEESKGAIAPLLTNLGLLREAFALAGDEGALSGSMLEEYRKQAATTANALRVTQGFLKAMAIAAGSVLLPVVQDLLRTVQPVIDAVRRWAEAHPELIRTLAKLAGGLVLFKLAALAASWSLLALQGPFLHLIRWGGLLLASLPGLAGGLVALLNPLNLVRGVFAALRLVFVATGIGALIAAVAGGGLWIYNNWSGLKAMFQGLWQGFRDALGPARPMIDTVIQGAQELWRWFTDLTGPVNASAAEWTAWGKTVGRAIGGTVNWLLELAGQVRDFLSPAVSQAGDLLRAAFEKVDISAIWQWIRDLAGQVQDFLSPAFDGLGQLLRAVFGDRGAADVIRDLAGALGAVLAVGGKSLKEIFGGIFDGFLPWLDPIITALRPLGEDLGRIFGDLGAIFGTISDWFSSLFSSDESAGGGAGFMTFLRGLGNVIGNILGAIATLAAVNLGVVVKVIGMIVRMIRALLAGDVDDALQPLKEYFLWLADIGMALLPDISVDDILEKIRGWFDFQWTDILPEWDWDAIIPKMPGFLSGLFGGNSDTPPGRDLGGPVRAGLPYLVGERGPEIMVPGTAGTILPGRVLRAAALASAVAAPSVAAAGESGIIGRIDRRPALSVSAPAPQVIRQGDTITINVHAAPGMSAEDIGREVERRLSRLQDARRGDLHDGVDY